MLNLSPPHRQTPCTSALTHLRISEFAAHATPSISPSPLPLASSLTCSLVPTSAAVLVRRYSSSKNFRPPFRFALPQFHPTRNRSPSGPNDFLPPPPPPPRSQIASSASSQVTVDETVVDRALESKLGHWCRIFLPNVSQKCAGQKKPDWCRIFFVECPC